MRLLLPDTRVGLPRYVERCTLSMTSNPSEVVRKSGRHEVENERSFGPHGPVSSWWGMVLRAAAPALDG